MRRSSREPGWQTSGRNLRGSLAVTHHDICPCSRRSTRRLHPLLHRTTQAGRHRLEDADGPHHGDQWHTGLDRKVAGGALQTLWLCADLLPKASKPKAILAACTFRSRRSFGPEICEATWSPPHNDFSWFRRHDERLCFSGIGIWGPRLRASEGSTEGRGSR